MRDDTRRSWAQTLAAQITEPPSDALQLDLVLGLVAGVSSAANPAGVLHFRVHDPDKRRAEAARYRAAARRVAPAPLSEPAAAAAFAAHQRRRAHRTQSAPSIAAQDQALAAAAKLRAERDAAEAAARAERSQRRREAGAELVAAAAGLLGRDLHPAVVELAGSVAVEATETVPVLLRPYAADPDLAHDLAAVCRVAGVDAEVLASPVQVLPAGPLRTALHTTNPTAAAPAAAHSPPPAHELLTAAIDSGRPPPAGNSYGQLSGADLDRVLTHAAGASLDPRRRRAWGRWLIAQRTTPEPSRRRDVDGEPC